MSNQFAPYQQQPPNIYPQPQQKSGSGCGWGLLIGCLGTLVVCVLLCAGVAWYVGQNYDKWIIGAAREFIVATINGSEIPAEEKTKVITQVDRVVNAYKERKINGEDLQRIFEKIQKSPVFMLLPLWGLEKQYLEPSGLSDEEKEQGKQTIQRALRGVYEKKITDSKFQEALPPQFRMPHDANVNVGADGKVEPPPPDPAAPPPGRLTDDEVRKLLADLKKLADDAAVPDEPFEIDIGGEVKKAVDEALAGKGVP